MYQTGGFWAPENHPRDHCFRVVPLQGGKPVPVRESQWNRIYERLGKLGYLFRDAGHSWDYAPISLNMPISQRHLRQLQRDFSIQPDSGDGLGGCLYD